MGFDGRAVRQEQAVGEGDDTALKHVRRSSHISLWNLLLCKTSVGGRPLQVFFAEATHFRFQLGISHLEPVKQRIAILQANGQRGKLLACRLSACVQVRGLRLILLTLGSRPLSIARSYSAIQLGFCLSAIIANRKPPM